MRRGNKEIIIELGVIFLVGLCFAAVFSFGIFLGQALVQGLCGG